MRPTPELAFRSPQDHWQITYDRRWHLVSDDRDRAVLKLINAGRLERTVQRFLAAAARSE